MYYLETHYYLEINFSLPFPFFSKEREKKKKKIENEENEENEERQKGIKSRVYLYMSIDLSKSASKLRSGKITLEVILGALFIVYLIMGYPTPQPLADLVNSNAGVFVVVIMFLSLFFYCNPIVAILGLFVGFEMIRRSQGSYHDAVPPLHDASVVQAVSNMHSNQLLEENKKQSFFSASNQFPYTLEEEVVKHMAPPQSVGPRTYQDEYQPLLDNIHDAESLSR